MNLRKRKSLKTLVAVTLVIAMMLSVVLPVMANDAYTGLENTPVNYQAPKYEETNIPGLEEVEKGYVEEKHEYYVEEKYEYEVVNEAVQISPLDDNLFSVNVGRSSSDSDTLFADVVGHYLTLRVHIWTSDISLVEGTHYVTVANLPPGVTLGWGGQVRIDAQGGGSLALRADNALPGVFDDLVLTIAGVESNAFTVRVIEQNNELRWVADDITIPYDATYVDIPIHLVNRTGHATPLSLTVNAHRLVTDGYISISEAPFRPEHPAWNMTLGWRDTTYLLHTAGPYLENPDQEPYLVNVAGMITGNLVESNDLYHNTTAVIRIGIMPQMPTNQPALINLSRPSTGQTIAGNQIQLPIEITSFTITRLPYDTPTVAVGSQQGTMLEGVVGTVTFPVTTTNIANGYHFATVANLPTGVTVAGQVNINNGSGTLTLAGDTTTLEGITSTLTLTLGGATSNTFTLAIGDFAGNGVWRVTYLGNSHTAGNPPAFSEYERRATNHLNHSVLAAPTGFARAGFNQVGWLLNNPGFTLGGVQMTGSAVSVSYHQNLYARWQAAWGGSALIQPMQASLITPVPMNNNDVSFVDIRVPGPNGMWSNIDIVLWDSIPGPIGPIWFEIDTQRIFNDDPSIVPYGNGEAGHMTLTYPLNMIEHGQQIVFTFGDPIFNYAPQDRGIIFVYRYDVTFNTRYAGATVAPQVLAGEFGNRPQWPLVPAGTPRPAAPANPERQIVEPTDPIRGGFNFGGWFTSEAAAAGTGEAGRWDFDDTITADQTLFARWTAQTGTPTVVVGSQIGPMIEGVAGTVTFPVTTTNIANGTYTVSVANLPTGVTVQGQVTINNGSGILTLAGDTTTLAGVTNTLVLTLGGATSNMFTLTINEPGIWMVTFLPGMTPTSPAITNMPDPLIKNVVDGDEIGSAASDVTYPESEGYTFLGWKQTTPVVTGALSPAEVEDITVSQNKIFTAQWQRNQGSGGGSGGSGGGGGGGGNVDEPTPTPETEITKIPDRVTINVGETINWTLKGFHNPTGNAVTNFTVVDIPSLGLNFQSGRIPAFHNGAGITYDIRYRVAGSNEWHTHASNVDASRPFNFTLSETGDVHYTAIGLFFGNVPSNFGRGNEMVFTFRVTDEALGNTVINRLLVGYEDVELEGYGYVNFGAIGGTIFSSDHEAYLVGFPDGTIRPNNTITRAEVATIIFRLLDDSYRTQIWRQSNPFSDVVSTNWFNNAVSTLTNADILTGFPDGTFRGNQAITRAEFVAIVARFLDDTNYTGADRFNDISGHWAREYINLAGQYDWIVGIGNGDFRPNQNITRAEAAAIINRMLERQPESAADLLPGMATWPDNANQNAWFYLYIQEATNSHDFEMKADGVHETWTEIREPRDWTVLERPNSRPQDIL